MNIPYCKCAFTTSDGDFVPGEACPIHPDAVDWVSVDFRSVRFSREELLQNCIEMQAEIARLSGEQRGK